MTKKISFAAKPALSADKWVENRANNEGEVRTDKGTAIKRLTLDFPEELHRQLKMHCVKQGINMLSFLRELVEEAIKQGDKDSTAL